MTVAACSYHRIVSRQQDSPSVAMLRFEIESAGPRGMTRKEFLRIAGGGSLATALGRRLHAASSTSSTAIAGVRRAKSVIVVFANGGQSQLEMWDPKPEAPREIRGEFSAIPTSVSGTLFGEHLPQMAKVADKLALIRTMSHLDLDHGSAVYLTLTGRYHARITSNPAPQPTDSPSLLSIYQRIRPNTGSFAPSVQVNGPVIVAPQDIAPGQYSGLLGRDFDPMAIGNVNQPTVAVPGLSTHADLPTVRLRDRERLLMAVDRAAQEQEVRAKYADVDGQYHKAFELLTDPRTRQAFDLSQEPDALRRRYGRHRSGQACLLARRLAAAGVPLITVVWNHQSRGQDKSPDDDELFGWDTHNDIFDVLKHHLLPKFDQSFSALLEDLDTRGMLDDTLVLCVTEFGRAPLVALERSFAGASPGRKHWAAAYSVVMAGAGVSRGKVVGKTDRAAAYPVSERFGPWDVAATIFAALGVSPEEEYRDPLNRPFAVTSGKPILAAYE